MTDSNREASLDKMVSETKALINQANDTASGLKNALRSLGCTDSSTLRKLLQSDDCPADLKQKASGDLEKLQQELAEEENQLRAAGNQGGGTNRPRPRSGMTKI